jgi:hypothetical protein
MSATSFGSAKPAGAPESAIAAESALSFGTAPADARPNIFTMSAKVFKVGKSVYQWKKRVDYLREMLDEEKRTGALFKAGLDWVPNLLTKALEASFGTKMPVPLQAHPYFRYHKQQLEELGKFTQEMRQKQKIDELRAAANRALARVLAEAQRFVREFPVAGERWQTQRMRIALSNGASAAGRQFPGPRDIVSELSTIMIRREIKAEMVAMLELEAALTAARYQVDIIMAERTKMIEGLNAGNLYGQFFGVMTESEDFHRNATVELGWETAPEAQCDAALARLREVVTAWAEMVDSQLEPSGP